MRDIINAGLDPHRWFAGVMNRLITADISFTKDPNKVISVSRMLEEKISEEVRNKAKAAKPKLALQEVIPVEQESELLEGPRTWNNQQPTIRMTHVAA